MTHCQCQNPTLWAQQENKKLQDARVCACVCARVERLGFTRSNFQVHNTVLHHFVFTSPLASVSTNPLVVVRASEACEHFESRTPRRPPISSRCQEHGTHAGKLRGRYARLVQRSGFPAPSHHSLTLTPKLTPRELVLDSTVRQQ